MVQVDVFWSYALGAGFAYAASTQLQISIQSKDAEYREGPPWHQNRYFTYALLFLATIFAPSGVCLLWAFPSWETMHVFDRSLWAWLVTGFAVTNVTQGVLGFWITWRCLKAGKKHLAFLQMVLGYFFMFFILVHGWDGTGYKRFFSATKGDFLNWELANIPAWLISDVAITLYLMGIVLIPALLVPMSIWLQKGIRLQEGNTERALFITRGQIAKEFLTLIFAGALVLAIAASLLIHWLGWAIGALVFAVVGYFLAFRKGGYLNLIANNLE